MVFHGRQEEPEQRQSCGAAEDSALPDLVTTSVVPTTGAVLSPRLLQQLRYRREGVSLWMSFAGRFCILSLVSCEYLMEELRRGTAALLEDLACRSNLSFRWILKRAIGSICGALGSDLEA